MLGLGLGLGLGCVSVGEWRVGWVEWVDTQIVYLAHTDLRPYRSTDPPIHLPYLFKGSARPSMPLHSSCTCCPPSPNPNTLTLTRRGPPEHPFALFLHLLSGGEAGGRAAHFGSELVFSLQDTVTEGQLVSTTYSLEARSSSLLTYLLT